MTTSQPLLRATLREFEQLISRRRTLYVTLNSLSAIALWCWFYFFSAWLSGFIMANQFFHNSWQLSLFFLVLFTMSRFGAIQLRLHLQLRVSTNFYHRFFAELAEKRWALIRQKPITAWQDVTFRHLPAVEQYLIDYLAQQQMLVIIPIFVLIVVFPISWLAGILLLLTLPLIPLFMWLVGAGTASAQRKHMLSLNRLGSFFSDRILGQKTVRILQQEAIQLRAFELSSQHHNQRLAEILRLAFLSNSVLDFFATVSVALVAVFIGFSLLGEINIGFWGQTSTLHEGLFLLLLAPAFFNEFKLLGKLYHAKAEATASVDLWQHTFTWHDKNETREPVIKKLQTLIIKRASINGFDHRPLLNIEYIKATEHDRILLQGKSGSGKTVLLDALAGLRSFNGDLYVNQQQQASLRNLQSQVLYLQQQPMFFDGSIRDNLGLGKANDNAILTAIQTVGLTDWFKQLPAGLDTQFNEQTNLSGGQKQKLALTRVLIFNVSLVLLDEPFTHLTQEEQEDLFQCLNTVLTDRLSIWVSHRDLPKEAFTQVWRIESGTLFNNEQTNK